MEPRLSFDGVAGVSEGNKHQPHPSLVLGPWGGAGDLQRDNAAILLLNLPIDVVLDIAVLLILQQIVSCDLQQDLLSTTIRARPEG